MLAFEFLRLHHIPPYSKQHPRFFFENGYSFSTDIDYPRHGYKYASPSEANSRTINNLEIFR